MGLYQTSKSYFIFLCVSSLFVSINCGTELCIEQMESITDCWLHYGDPPNCNGRSSMVLCAQERYDSVINCTDSVLLQLHRMIDSYVVMEDILCENDDLHTEIQKRKSCWPVLRSCALQVLMVAKENSEEECGEVMSMVRLCAILNDGCSEVHLPYMADVIEESNCEGLLQLKNSEISPEMKSGLVDQTCGASTICATFAFFAIPFMWFISRI